MLEKIIKNIKKAGLILLTTGLAYSAPLKTYPKVKIEFFNGNKYEGRLINVGHSYYKPRNELSDISSTDKIRIKRYYADGHKFYNINLEDISNIEFSYSKKDIYCSEHRGRNENPKDATVVGLDPMDDTYYNLNYTFTLRDNTKITTDYFGWGEIEYEVQCYMIQRAVEFVIEVTSEESTLLKRPEKGIITPSWVLGVCYMDYKNAPTLKIEEDKCASDEFKNWKHKEGYIIKNIQFIQPK